MGANQGRRRAVLEWAVRHLAAPLGRARVAPLFETEPVSEVAQGPYLNTAMIGESHLAPVDLLAVAKAIELAAGRRRGERWGPRPLDIDLLLYDDLERSESELTLPHPRLRERLFQLAPLAEIAPRWRVPPDGATVEELRAGLEGDAGKRIEWAPLPLG